MLLHGITDLLIAIERSPELKAALARAGKPETATELRCTLTAARERKPLPAFSVKERAGRSPRGSEMELLEGPQTRAPEGWEHPFVVEAARLCLEALAVAQGPSDKEALEGREKFIWDDEGVAVGHGGDLHVDALRLLGDVAILLNLNEKGNDGKKEREHNENGHTYYRPWSDRRLRERFGENDYLPDCLALGKDRWAKINTECTCDFERCPYDWSARRAHREISKVFCNRVAEEVKDPPPWQPDVSHQAYRRFWEQMEQNAKYVGS